MQIGTSGYLKAIYTHRNVNDFVQTFVTRETGTTDVVKNGVDFGTFANRLWANTNAGERTYDALAVPGRLPARLQVERRRATTRCSSRTTATRKVKAANQPGAPSFFSGYYPELFNEARTYPIGRLDDFQRHRVRAWSDVRPRASAARAA